MTVLLLTKARIAQAACTMRVLLLSFPSCYSLLSQGEGFGGQHPAWEHNAAAQQAHGGLRRLQAVAADGGAAPELVPDVLHGEQVAAAKHGLEQQDAASDAADPGKDRILGGSHGRHADSGDADPDFQPAAFQGKQHSQRHAAKVDSAHHVADQLQPSQQLAQQRTQETETLQNQLLLESLKAKDGGQRGQGGAAASHGETAGAGIFERVLIPMFMYHWGTWF